MKKLRGMLDLAKLKSLSEEDEIDTVIVAFSDHFGRLMGKRFDVDFFLDGIYESGTHCCDYLLTTDMEMEPVQGYHYANWELGYGDFHLVPDLNTMRIASWLDRTALVLCDVKNEKTHEAVSVAPRSILKNQLKAADAMGFKVNAASELEYYLFQTTYKQAASQQHVGLEPVGWYLEDYHILQGTREERFHQLARRHLRDSGVPVETSKGEWGLGQHELNVRYTDALGMADRHTVFKQCLKEVADGMDLSVTFMAKFMSGRAGSSCHLHISMWKGDENAFDGNEMLGPIKCSALFRHFLGGWIKHAPEFMVFYAPTVNSYKRFEDGSWAPTRLAWCYDNRTAGFRVVGRGSSLRIECRIPGADCNPYLAFAAALASGLDGIKNKIEPPEMFVGDVYAAQHLPRVPYTLKEAITSFEGSEFVKEAMGADVVEHYSHFYKTEQKAFDAFVTDWERTRYFERI